MGIHPIALGQEPLGSPVATAFFPCTLPPKPAPVTGKRLSRPTVLGQEPIFKGEIAGSGHRATLHAFPELPVTIVGNQGKASMVKRSRNPEGSPGTWWRARKHWACEGARLAWETWVKRL